MAKLTPKQIKEVQKETDDFMRNITTHIDEAFSEIAGELAFTDVEDDKMIDEIYKIISETMSKNLVEYLK